MEFITWLAVGVVVGLGLGFLRRKAGGPIALHAIVTTVGALVSGAIVLPLIGVWMKKNGMTNVFAGGPDFVSVAEAVVGAVVVYFAVAKLGARAEKRSAARGSEGKIAQGVPA